ncbi:hypothetical protein P43SY_009916 [Pythium insidiosum]|uniref:Uncharacterized protein n=1 Tax=Pythium insidiosum TaxID=114742 RepID=A0AAD5Q620_PYTIN|nr:hypothetical protein P43SY_009916 [Pythium insidiosum]
MDAVPAPAEEDHDATEVIQAATFRVESCINVREHYKAKLRVLLDAILPGGVVNRHDSNVDTNKRRLPQTTQRLASIPVVPCSPSQAAALARKARGPDRDVVAARLRVRATVPQGKEMHVIGDWLLLLRAASVDVVEAVQQWRQVVHQGRPVPYQRGGQTNYLLQMCDDTDFLNECADLVEWLGFPLARNPFIVREAMERVGSSSPGDRFSTAPSDQRCANGVSPMSLPPAALVKPLISILPEDDVVDGARITVALSILRDEEALFGRMTLLRDVRRYLSKTQALPSGSSPQLELGGGESFAQFSQMKQRVGDESRKASDRFHVSVYSHRAKGYTQDGLRFVAMDPASQSTFAMTMSSREYNALGYGRTREGLAAFCRWLCLVYERRARQFRLVWSGAPCPPPLRVRDYDQALWCVHKEGLRVASAWGAAKRPVSVLAALFARHSADHRGLARLQLVQLSIEDGQSTEHVLSVHRLLPLPSLVVRDDSDGSPSISWLHERHCATPVASEDKLFSGETLLAGQRWRVLLYDTSTTEYTVCVEPLTPGDSATGAAAAAVASGVLRKSLVNPYSVRLPYSAISELVHSLQIRHDPATDGLLVEPSDRWHQRLASYIRVLPEDRVPSDAAV